MLTHITVEVPPEQWGTVEGLKTLCGVESDNAERFQFFDTFVKAGMLRESEVCQECLEIFRQKGIEARGTRKRDETRSSDSH